MHSHQLSVYLLLSSLATTTTADTLLEWSAEAQGYSGPIAIMALDNDWNGTLKQDDHGFLWQQERLSVQHNDFSVSYLKRHHAEYDFPNAVARGFYYQSNGIKLDERYDIQSHIRARHYQGEGISLDYQWSGQWASQWREQTHRWTIKPAFTWLKLHRLVWGSLDGELYYQTPNDWGGDVQLDYAYTRDYVVRRPLDGHTYGNLWAMDLNASYQWQDFSWHYQGYNLLAQIHWSDAPYTQAKFCTSCTFLLLGREYYDTRKFRAPAVHQLDQRYQLNHHWRVGLVHHINRIRSTHELHLQYLTENVEWTLGYEPQLESWLLGVEHSIFTLAVQSDALNTTSSRRIGLQMGLRLRF